MRYEEVADVITFWTYITEIRIKVMINRKTLWNIRACVRSIPHTYI